LRLDPPLVGINNRNLRDLTVNLETTRLLRPLAPAPAVVVSESGIHSAAEMSALASWGVDAALVGEALVSAPDPAARLRELLEAGR
jgi:indole-3-glycerol phosphate synthase